MQDKGGKVMVINPVIYDEGKGNDIFSSNLENRIIHVVGEVCDEMAASVTAQILYLIERACAVKDINLYINSPGGSVSAGLAIYDTMKYAEKQGCMVNTFCIGRAASMGAVLLSGGTKGHRFVLPHAEVMIHQPSGGMEGQSSDMLIAADHIRDTREVLNMILSENTGKGIEGIRKCTDRDYWMKADEAVKFGIVDAILG